MFAYPENVVRVMQPQIENLKYVVKCHFKKRHINGNTPVRNWLGELRRVKAGCGYDIALEQIRVKG